jgi:hypothetical protein
MALGEDWPHHQVKNPDKESTPPQMKDLLKVKVRIYKIGTYHPLVKNQEEGNPHLKATLIKGWNLARYLLIDLNQNLLKV